MTRPQASFRDHGGHGSRDTTNTHKTTKTHNYLVLELVLPESMSQLMFLSTLCSAQSEELSWSSFRFLSHWKQLETFSAARTQITNLQTPPQELFLALEAEAGKPIAMVSNS